MSLSELKAWCQAAAFVKEGLASLGNMLHDLRHRRLETLVTFREFAAAIAMRWRVPDAAWPLDMMETVVSDSYCARGVPIQSGPVDCSRVMVAHDFLKRHIDRAKAGIPIEEHRYPTADDILSLQDRGLEGIVQESELRGRRPIGWVTRTEALDAIRSETDVGTADRVRNLLGLRHLDRDYHVVEVLYPRCSPEELGLRVPTFLDGCPSLIFRSRTATDDGWGRTVQLKSYADGLPEAVHPPLPFDARFRVRWLGRITEPLPAEDWERHLEALPDPWSHDALVELDDYFTE